MTHKASGGRVSSSDFSRTNRPKTLSTEFLLFIVVMTCVTVQGAMTYLAANSVKHVVEQQVTEVTSYE